MEDIKESIVDLTCVPVGIFKADLSIATLNLKENLGTVFASNKLNNLKGLCKSIVKVFKQLGQGVILLDGTKDMVDIKDDTANYFAEDLDKINEVIDKNIEENTVLKAAIVIFGIDKLLSKLEDSSKLEELIKRLKKYEQVPAIVIEDGTKMKNYLYETWYKDLFENNAGIWVGTGVGDQTVLKVNGYDKALAGEFPNNMGFYVAEGIVKPLKLIELTEDGVKEDEQ